MWSNYMLSTVYAKNLGCSSSHPYWPVVFTLLVIFSLQSNQADQHIAFEAPFSTLAALDKCIGQPLSKKESKSSQDYSHGVALDNLVKSCIASL